MVGQFFKDLNPQKLNKVNEAAAKYEKTKFDESKKDAKKKNKKDDRMDLDEFKKEIEVDPPKPKPKGPPAAFMKRQEEAAKKPAKEEKKEAPVQESK